MLMIPCKTCRYAVDYEHPVYPIECHKKSPSVVSEDAGAAWPVLTVKQAGQGCGDGVAKEQSQ